MRRASRPARAVLAAALVAAASLAVAGGLAGTGAATAGILGPGRVLASGGIGPAAGVTGEPQPELRPFRIGTASGPGTVALEPDGTVVAAFQVASSGHKTSRTTVCLIARTGRRCSGATTLVPSAAAPYGVPEVFVTAQDHVTLLTQTCCDGNPAGGDLLYGSADGGASFGSAVRLGTIGVDVAELVSSDVVFSASHDTAGTEVESVPDDASGPPGTTAVANTKTAFAVGVGSYQGGVLAASDYVGPNTITTYAEYAPSGSDFDASTSYGSAGSFGNQDLVGLSGDALLTQQTTARQGLELRFFTGSGFGTAHMVPGTAGGGGWAAVQQDPSGAAHVFWEAAGTGYHLIEESTRNGRSWSGPVDLGSAITSDFFSAALDASGAGLVLGTGGGQVWGYPVLAAQSVTLRLKSAVVRAGRADAASGTASPARSGRLVQLQQERAGRWYPVATARENASGSFSFRIAGSAPGRHEYRAVVADLPGRLLYGYSPARTVRVTG
jgi:hypothetical protein